MRRARAALRIWRMVAVCALAAAPVQSGAQRARDIEGSGRHVPTGAGRVLLDVRIDDALHTPMVARVPLTGGFLLPLEPLLQFVGIRYSTRAGALVAAGGPSRPRFRLYSTRSHISINGTDFTLQPEETAQEGDTTLIDAGLAARLLGVAIEFDLGNAIVMLRGAENLPVAQQNLGRRESRRRLLEQVAERDAPELVPRMRTAIQSDYSLFVRRSTGALAFTSSAVSTDRTVWSAAFETHLAGRVAGGSLSGRLAAVSGMPISDVRWTRYRPTSRKLTRVIIGATDAGGLSTTSLQGVRVDNYPVDIAVSRTVLLRGRGDAGWEYSAQQGNEWSAAVSGADGAYAFRLPVIGDVSRIDIYGWGPGGQQRRVTRSIHAVPIRVKRGAWQYSASAGRCNRSSRSWLALPELDSCSYFAGIETRTGLTDWLAARTGVDAVPGRLAPYVGVAAVIGHAMTVHAASNIGAGEQRHRGSWSVQYEPTPAFALSVSRGTGVSGARTETAFLRMAPLRWDGRLAVNGWIANSDRTGVTSRINHLGIVGARRAVRLELFASDVRTGASGTPLSQSGFRGRSVGADVTLTPSWLRAGPLERAWVTTTIERTVRGAMRGNLRLFGSFAPVFVALEHEMPSLNTPGRWSLTLSPRSSRVRETTTLSRTAAGPGFAASSSVLQSVSGSASFESDGGRVALAADQAANRGAVHGRVFLDLNSNGRLDSGEPAIPDVPVTIANRRMMTDSLGRFRVRHLTAAELIDVSIDSTALPAPCWRPAAPKWRVRAADASVVDVALPVLRGGLLEGRIIRAADSLAARAPRDNEWSATARLRAIAIDSSATYDLDVFGTGSFYMLGIPFGTYDIVMPEPDQQRLGLIVTPVRVDTRRGSVDGDGTPDALTACPRTTAIVRARIRAGAGAVGDALTDVRIDTTNTVGVPVISVTPLTQEMPERVSSTTVMPPHGGKARIGNSAAARHAMARSPKVSERPPRTRRAKVSHLRLRRTADSSSRTSLPQRASPFVVCDPDDPRQLTLTSVHFTVGGCPTDRWRRSVPAPRPMDMRREPFLWRRDPD